jgi:hypothetical protein
MADAQGLRQTNVFLNQTRSRAPAFTHLQLARADLVVAVGVVEPHLYAGFSGGAKTVAIGCAGARTIAWTHDPRFLDRPGIELGRLEGNPFQEVVRELAALTSLRFALDAVVDEQGHAVALAAGGPAAAQAALAGRQRDAWLRTVRGRYDLVVAGLPAPKHRSLYHATRAATYLALGERSPVADEGLVLLCADVENGVGDGPGELNFGALMAGAERPETLLEAGRHGEPLGPGGQRAYMMAKVLSRCRVGVLQPADPALCGSLGLDVFASVDQALKDTARRIGRPPRVLIVSDGIGTIVHSSPEAPAGAPS